MVDSPSDLDDLYMGTFVLRLGRFGHFNIDIYIYIYILYIQIYIYIIYIYLSIYIPWALGGRPVYIYIYIYIYIYVYIERYIDIYICIYPWALGSSARS